ncbi:hypothetical protein Xdur_004135 [Xanthomonas citri pv. durantae]|uniref:Uncharacterized protein n=1 Tax=Xanthomonas citri pv. durantae TaxID=487862 RepID=A0A9X9IJN0_XANCI|nr:hypothetical protein B7L65_19635 [Xanthomonas citri pv. citri]UVG61017.1 hypothetical protein Xdur_004135 [Xanthomonas citri pv. durantae]ARR24328.1 hypothetical protein B7L67_02845 [Xanthomonas citri pv. citri]MBD1531494.1 hypothetical protein [Xanthomonas citri pv. citri]MBD4667184.1 hypothetical protein [Xanthomonas citri pv. citri]
MRARLEGPAIPRNAPLHIRTLHLQATVDLRQRASPSPSPSPTMRVHAGHPTKPALALQLLRIDIRHLARTKHL